MVFYALFYQLRLLHMNMIQTYFVLQEFLPPFFRRWFSISSQSHFFSLPAIPRHKTICIFAIPTRVWPNYSYPFCTLLCYLMRLADLASILAQGCTLWTDSFKLSGTPARSGGFRFYNKEPSDFC